MKNLLKELVPENRQGKPVDLDHSVTTKTPEEAISLFNRARQRLFTPEAWHTYSGMLSATFRVMDTQNQELSGPPRRGDFIRIDIPGPGGSQGDGFDWVQVEAVIDEPDSSADKEQAGFLVRTANRPQRSEHTPAHFFADGATSTFILERIGQTVTARYFGRNEVRNTDADKTLDNIRNTMVALGALAGFSDLQWTTLIKGWLED